MYMMPQYKNIVSFVICLQDNDLVKRTSLRFLHVYHFWNQNRKRKKNQYVHGYMAIFEYSSFCLPVSQRNWQWHTDLACIAGLHASSRLHDRYKREALTCDLWLWTIHLESYSRLMHFTMQALTFPQAKSVKARVPLQGSANCQGGETAWRVGWSFTAAKWMLLGTR